MKSELFFYYCPQKLKLKMLASYISHNSFASKNRNPLRHTGSQISLRKPSQNVPDPDLTQTGNFSESLSHIMDDAGTGYILFSHFS